MSEIKYDPKLEVIEACMRAIASQNVFEVRYSVLETADPMLPSYTVTIIHLDSRRPVWNFMANRPVNSSMLDWLIATKVQAEQRFLFELTMMGLTHMYNTLPPKP